MKSKSIKLLALSCALSAAGWSSAYGCSYSFEKNAAFNYQILDQGRLNTQWARWAPDRSELSLNTILSQLDVLIIAKPIEGDITTQTPSRWGSLANDAREYRRIQWDILKTLKGEPTVPLYLRGQKGKITRALSQDTETPEHISPLRQSQSKARESFIEDVENRVTDRNSFAFWDAPQFDNVQMTDVTRMTSCGEVQIPAYDFSRYYLVGLDKSGTTVFAEPLKDEADPLIAGAERIITSGQFSPDISTGEFFSEMETRDIVEIQSCSLELQNRNATSQLWQPYNEEVRYPYPSDPSDFPKEIKFKSISPSTDFSVNLERLSKSSPALLEYFNKDKSKVTCQAGERFAVYADTDQYASPTHYAVFPIIPEFRFARVKDGMINIEDIRTNYTLTGPKYVPVEAFLNPK